MAKKKQPPSKPNPCPYLNKPDPWPDPVADGESLLHKVRESLERFIVLPEHASEAIVLYIAFTYFVEAADICPMLYIRSPERQCGKTQLLGIIADLAYRAVPTANISPAALYRVVEQYNPTLVIDEGDSFLGDNNELRGILNSGHDRSSAFTWRCEGDSHQPRQFSTFGPKVLAAIGALDDTLVDRSIAISMRRKLPGESVERLSRRARTQFEPTRMRLLRWATDNTEPFQELAIDPLLGLTDRAFDNWEPLLGIAELAGGDWPELARKAALSLSLAPEQMENASTLLLSDLRDLFDERREERLPTGDILEYLRGLEDRPWATWHGGREISAQAIAKLFKPYGIRPSTHRINSSPQKGYARSECEDAFARYISNQAGDSPPGTRVTPLQPAKTEDLQSNGSVTRTVTEPEPSADELREQGWEPA